ncbi:MAG: hypothetical protein II720_03480 [Bacteroidales bacterium]|nr:hypothetical protein [Bacteroidales bacterium]
MRKSILFGLAILSLAAVSCSREMEAPVAKSDVKVVTLGAALSDTKAAISDAGKFTWQEGDELSVATDGGFVTFKLTAGAGSDKADFTAILDAKAQMGEVAVYPAGAHALAGNSLTVNLPAEYVYEEANTNVPLLGAVTDHAVAMKYIGGVVRFPVSNMPAGAAKVVLYADKKISGDFTLDVTQAEAALAAGEGASEVAYTIATVEPNMVFNFPLPVGEYNLKLQILDASGAPLFEKAGAAASTVAVGTVLAYNELSFSVAMNDNSYRTVADALAAAEALTEGTAAIKLLEDIKENIVVDGRKVKVPVAIDGNGKTIDGAVEILQNETSIVNATIKPSAARNFTAFDKDADNLPGLWPNNFGIYVHSTGYGVTLDNVTLDVTALNTENEASGSEIGTAIYFRQEGDAPTAIKRDAIKNSKILGRTHRLMQIFNVPLDLVDNRFAGAYSYAIRVYTGCDLLLKGNKFNNGSNAAIDYRSDAQNGVLVLGDGFTNDNSIDETYQGFIKGSAASLEDAANNIFRPALVAQDGWLVPQNAEAPFAERIWGKTLGELGIPGVTASQQLMQAIQGGHLWIAKDEVIYGFDLLTGAAHKNVTFPVPVRSLDSDDTATNIIIGYERGFHEGDPQWDQPEPVFSTTNIEEVGGTLDEPVGFRTWAILKSGWGVGVGSPTPTNFKMNGTFDAGTFTFSLANGDVPYTEIRNIAGGELKIYEYIRVSNFGSYWNAFNSALCGYGTKITDGVLLTFASGGGANPVYFGKDGLTQGWTATVGLDNWNVVSPNPVIDGLLGGYIYRTDLVTFNGKKIYGVFQHPVWNRTSDFLNLYDVTDINNIVKLGVVGEDMFVSMAEGYDTDENNSTYAGDLKLQVIDGNLYAFMTDGRRGTVNAFKINIPERPVLEGEVEGPDVTVTPGGKF